MKNNITYYYNNKPVTLTGKVKLDGEGKEMLGITLADGSTTYATTEDIKPMMAVDAINVVCVKTFAIQSKEGDKPLKVHNGSTWYTIEAPVVPGSVTELVGLQNNQGYRIYIPKGWVSHYFKEVQRS